MKSVRNSACAFSLAFALSLAGIAMAAPPAAAWSDSASAKIPGTGAIIQANAWQCNTYVDKCSFATSSKALKKKSKKYRVGKIVNVATLKANGISATISTSPSGTFVSENVRRIKWTNRNTWISDISGIADPGGSLNTSMTTCSDASVITKGVKGFAAACVNG